MVDFHRAFFIPFWEREGVAAPDEEAEGDEDKAEGWLAALGRRPRFGADAVAERTASKLGSWGPGRLAFLRRWGIHGRGNLAFLLRGNRLYREFEGAVSPAPTIDWQWPTGSTRRYSRASDREAFAGSVR
ncbi:hypothetical protein [Anaeromassilibacillus sp. SJQ-1]|uniref:hypothetical protein n=1 Tax=Anaeromassilibacillus sp. SJQ-1 TaxID=3375419 RepID=UPI0039894DF8